MVDKGSEVLLSHEAFINGYASIAGRGRIVRKPGAVGELGEVGCTTLNINNTRIVNRGTLHVGRKYVGGVTIALLGEAQIINEGVLGMTRRSTRRRLPAPRTERRDYIPPGAELPLRQRSDHQHGHDQDGMGRKHPGSVRRSRTTARSSRGKERSHSAEAACQQNAQRAHGRATRSHRCSRAAHSTLRRASPRRRGVQGGAGVDGCPAPKPPSRPAPGKTPTARGAEGGSENTPAKDESDSEEFGEGSKRLAAASCVVPRLHAGSTLRRARKLLAARHCRPGRIYHLASHKVRPARVVALRAHAGARLPHDAAVAILIAETPRVVTTHVGYV